MLKKQITENINQNSKTGLILFVLIILGLFILGLLSIGVFLTLITNVNVKGDIFSQNSIAIIPIKGLILTEPEPFNPNAFNLKKTIENLDLAADNPSIKAIVLEIDSPGGAVVPTKQIVRKLLEIKKSKPIVAHINEIGTSGGYYIAASANEVLAEEDALTGSIGVITETISIEKLLANYGVDVNLLTKGKLKSMGHPFKDLTEEEKQVFDVLLQEVYDSFVQNIKEFRAGKLSIEFEKIADGRILSGNQAKKIGLIDEIGSKEDALERAKELAGIESYSIKEYSTTNENFISLFSQLGYNFGQGFKTGLTTTTNSNLIQLR